MLDRVPCATKVSVMIPAYNEGANIEGIVERILQFSGEDGIDCDVETIVVDDG